MLRLGGRQSQSAKAHGWNYGGREILEDGRRKK